MTPAADFSPDGYRRLIGSFLDTGYEVRNFDDVEQEKPHLILRHDVDQSLQAAAQLAKLEANIGVSSTYFVLLRTEMYNPLSRDGMDAMLAIRACGHRIGLHFDASLYDDDRDIFEAAAERECAILETALEEAVGDISFHRPVRSLLGLPGRLAGRLHVYDPVFYSDMAYCSDSRGGWGHGHPCDHTAFDAHKAMQLLTHPVWWVTPDADPVEKIGIILDARLERLHRELRDNCEPWCNATRIDPAETRAEIPGRIRP